MLTRRKQKKSPLRLATEYFVAGVIVLIAAIVVNVNNTSCPANSTQLCIRYTYYGLDAQTFGIVLIVGALLCFGAGVFFLMQHRKGLENK